MGQGQISTAKEAIKTQNMGIRNKPNATDATQIKMLVKLGKLFQVAGSGGSHWEFCPKFLSKFLNYFMQYFEKATILT